MPANSENNELQLIHRIISDIRDTLPSFIKDHALCISSVIMDGSFIRGDYIPYVSDLDLTVTLKEDVTHVPEQVLFIQSFFDNKLLGFPPRPASRKPMQFDIQWQALNEVISTGQRPIDDWTDDNIPFGYPKLWLYAFDSIQNHLLIYGEDTTQEYTRISPAKFALLRLARINKSVLKYTHELSPYDEIHGTITQMKNAWEAIRATHLLLGGTTIHKKDVIESFKKSPLDFPQKAAVDAIWAYYQGTSSSYPNDMRGIEFRKYLYSFTLELLSAVAEWRGYKI